MTRAQSRRLAEAADRALLVSRLERLGLKGVSAVEVHANRTVLVTVTKRRVLRVHRGYAYATDRVLQAIVLFISPLTKGSRRKDAERTISDFPVDRYIRIPRRGRTRSHGDRRFVARLRTMFTDLNDEHFEDKLATIPLRVSRRMRTRLGELTVSAATGAATEIAISRLHIERDGWEEVEHTLLHEMVHQWQVESGLELDHGARFRAKAREVGIEPRARRDVRPVQPVMLEA